MLSWTVIRASTWLAGPWSMKLFYMLYFGAAGLYFPYVGLYYHAIHLNGGRSASPPRSRPWAASCCSRSGAC